MERVFFAIIAICCLIMCAVSIYNREGASAFAFCIIAYVIAKTLHTKKA